MKKTTNSKDALKPVPQQFLDKFVVSIIDALKEADSMYAVAEVKNIEITTELKELLLFVGITSKQSGNTALFTWTETLNNSSEDL